MAIRGTARRDIEFLLPVAAAVLSTSIPAAQASVTISSAATQNMTCASGVCTPTASRAILNVDDLETLLASGDATVTTTGQGVQAHDIGIKAPLTWSGSGILTLEARRSVTVNEPISIKGLSGLAVQAGSQFSFGSKGDVTFANLSSSLSINGAVFTLAADIKTLAADIAADPSGDFALANSYDASADGTYRASPIGSLSGTFDGLGNTISNLSIDGPTRVGYGLFESFFAEIEKTGTVESFAISNATMNVPANFGGALVGGGGLVAGANLGTVRSCAATGSVFGGKWEGYGPALGGLVANNYGTISHSNAEVILTAARLGGGGLVGWSSGSIRESYATGKSSGPRAGGGLVVDNYGIIMGSYATGPVLGRGGGGLAGTNYPGATISDSYAAGMVRDGARLKVGGLIGANYGSVAFSYSLGQVRAKRNGLVGGLIGDDGSQAGSLDDTYWDTDTSGVTKLSQGAGNIANDPGITGLTTTQFQSGLPAGFDPKVWAEKAGINGGLPYLLANRPRR